MTMTWMRFGLTAVTAAVLTACGGGGGSSGDTQLQYSITLRADRTNLPINLTGEGATDQSVYTPYTTTLYVQAKEGNDPIQGGEEIFACNVAGGLSSGALYYLDGDDEHTVEDANGNKVPAAYRSIVLGANAGGASFHFHAGNEAGTSTITCAVTDPRDQRVYSASVDITVGAATGKPASIQPKLEVPYYLGSRDNVNDIRNNVGVQAFVYDDANQNIPNPGVANLQVSILPTTDAAVGARLLSGSQSGGVVQVATTAGVGLFSLSSGPNSGAIVLELVTDRADNNVTNGIQDPVRQLTAVPVIDVTPGTMPLAIEDAELTAVNGVPYALALSATGGVAPYSWQATSALPNGLTLSGSGLISGTPNATAGDYGIVVTVTDQAGVTTTQNLTISISGATDIERAFSLNCVSSSGNACTLPPAASGSRYTYSFSASSSDSGTPITWSFSGLPSWLSGNAATGTITGTPTGTTDNCPSGSFQVTATQGALSLTRMANIAVTCPAAPAPAI